MYKQTYLQRFAGEQGIKSTLYDQLKMQSKYNETLIGSCRPLFEFLGILSPVEISVITFAFLCGVNKPHSPANLGEFRGLKLSSVEASVTKKGVGYEYRKISYSCRLNS